MFRDYISFVSWICSIYLNDACLTVFFSSFYITLYLPFSRIVHNLSNNSDFFRPIYRSKKKKVSTQVWFIITKLLVCSGIKHFFRSVSLVCFEKRFSWTKVLLHVSLSVLFSKYCLLLSVSANMQTINHRQTVLNKDFNKCICIKVFIFHRKYKNDEN